MSKEFSSFIKPRVVITIFCEQAAACYAVTDKAVFPFSNFNYFINWPHMMQQTVVQQTKKQEKYGIASSSMSWQRRSFDI